MTRRYSVAWGLAVVLCAWGAFAPNPRPAAAQPNSVESAPPAVPVAPAAPLPPVAVLPLETRTALPTEAALATERVREELTGTGKFAVLDQRQVEQAMTSLSLREAGCIVVQCAVTLGKKLGVRRVVTGSLTLKDSNHWVVSGYLVDVDQARTIAASTVESEGGSLTFISDAVAVVAARIAEVPPPTEALASGQIREQAPEQQRELAPRETLTGWAITAALPLAYTFDHGEVNRGASTSGAFQLSHTTTQNVDGFGVFLGSPWHIGLGLERYTVRQNVTLSSGCASACDGAVKLTLNLIDVMVNLPLRSVTLGLGYGVGDADFAFALDSHQPAPASVSGAHAEQLFVALSVPLGRRWEIYFAYHQVSVEAKELTASGTQPSSDALQASGHLYTFGTRINL